MVYIRNSLFHGNFLGSLPPILTFIPVSRLIGLSVCHEFKIPSLISEPCCTDVFMCYFYCETIIYGDCLSIHIQVFERVWKKERYTYKMFHIHCSSAVMFARQFRCFTRQF